MPESNNEMPPLKILVVEDCTADILLFRESLKEFDFNLKLYAVNDGDEAMEFLQKKGRFKDVPRPDFIILDLLMPKVNGMETLQQIKADPALRAIPVLVLATSDSGEDIAEAYANQAASYITKPIDLENYNEMIQNILRYWSQVVKLPSSEN